MLANEETTLQTSKQNYINSIPLEILRLIFSFLFPKDPNTLTDFAAIINLSLVSKLFYSGIFNMQFWKMLNLPIIKDIFTLYEKNATSLTGKELKKILNLYEAIKDNYLLAPHADIKVGIDTYEELENLVSENFSINTKLCENVIYLDLWIKKLLNEKFIKDALERCESAKNKGLRNSVILSLLAHKSIVFLPLQNLVPFTSQVLNQYQQVVDLITEGTTISIAIKDYRVILQTPILNFLAMRTSSSIKILRYLLEQVPLFFFVTSSFLSRFNLSLEYFHHPRAYEYLRLYFKQLSLKRDTGVFGVFIDNNYLDYLSDPKLVKSLFNSPNAVEIFNEWLFSIHKDWFQQLCDLGTENFIRFKANVTLLSKFYPNYTVSQIGTTLLKYHRSYATLPMEDLTTKTYPFDLLKDIFFNIYTLMQFLLCAVSLDNEKIANFCKYFLESCHEEIMKGITWSQLERMIILCKHLELFKKSEVKPAVILKKNSLLVALIDTTITSNPNIFESATKEELQLFFTRIKSHSKHTSPNEIKYSILKKFNVAQITSVFASLPALMRALKSSATEKLISSERECLLKIFSIDELEQFATTIVSYRQKSINLLALLCKIKTAELPTLADRNDMQSYLQRLEAATISSSNNICFFSPPLLSSEPTPFVLTNNIALTQLESVSSGDNCEHLAKKSRHT